MAKTIKDAVKMLPPQYRQSVLDLWALTNCMDLYDGQLSDYLKVIKDVFEYKNKECLVLRGKIQNIKRMVNKID